MRARKPVSSVAERLSRERSRNHGGPEHTEKLLPGKERMRVIHMARAICEELGRIGMSSEFQFQSFLRCRRAMSFGQLGDGQLSAGEFLCAYPVECARGV
jgi:hypothetical protein